MANIKSQIKRNRQNEKRRVRNRNMRGSARTAVGTARMALSQNDPNTREAVMKAISTLDKAAEKGVLHRNNAARRKSRLMKQLAILSAVDKPAIEEKPVAKKTTARKASGRKSTAKKSTAKKPRTKKAA